MRNPNGSFPSLCGLRRACLDVNKARFVLQAIGVDSREPSSLTSPRRKGYRIEHMGRLSRPFYIIGFSYAHIMKLLRLFKPSAGTSVSREETCTKAIRRLYYRYNGIFFIFCLLFCTRADIFFWA